MLDLSKSKRHRSVTMPSALKMMFLSLPWIFVFYGVLVLQDTLAFFNNSVPVQAEVVLAPASPLPTSEAAARGVEISDPRWYRPGFLYAHENGQTFVGGAIVEPFKWTYQPGDIVEIRYNRVAPQQAQPVTFLKFWWAPVSFIAGGLVGFLSIALAFYLAEREPLPGHRRRRKKRRRGLLARIPGFRSRQKEEFSLRRN